MCRGIICRHWQQICCSSRLYDGLFGEGSLRASANQARVLTWWPGLQQFACAPPPTHTTRELFLYTSPLSTLWFPTPYTISLFSTSATNSTLDSQQEISTRFVSFQRQQQQHQPHSFAFDQHGVPRWYVHIYIYYSNTLYSKAHC